jgi:tRNA/tmRNA/rRNA uracil-C5-methylase (TrmA/RlmC/RlmD family)
LSTKRSGEIKDEQLNSNFYFGALLPTQKKTRKNGHERGEAPPFATILKGLTPPPQRSVPQAVRVLAPLAHLSYEDELQAKNKALLQFWQQNNLGGTPEALVPSPRPRNYRTTSKRRALFHGKTLYLPPGDRTRQPPDHPFFSSPLEPESDTLLYRFLQKKLSEPAFQLIAGHLNFLIIRGSYEGRVVIFNVDMMNGPLVRKCKMLAGHLQKINSLVSAAFLYLDPTSSDYYLESRRRRVSFKKLFGPDKLQISYGGVRYQFHPTSFSQVNQSMVTLMLQRAKELLAPAPGDCLLDLYCGYGLFSLFFSPACRQVIGVDAEGPSIRAAIRNSRLAGKAKANIRFLTKRITPSLMDELPQAFRPNLVLLDPPRQGPRSGVIPSIARRWPDKVLHIFCGVDQIPASLGQWGNAGYHAQTIVPLDMFAGTANLEVMILLQNIN